MFSNETQAKRDRLRTAYEASNAYMGQAKAEATQGMSWRERLRFELPETDESDRLHAELVAAEDALPWWQRLDLWMTQK